MKRWIWDRSLKKFVHFKVNTLEEFRTAVLSGDPRSGCSKCGAPTYDGLCGKCAYEIAGPKEETR